MLKIEDFKDFGTKEFLLAWKRFKEDGQDKEIDLSFCAQPYKDDVWYQIVIGDCLDDDFVETDFIESCVKKCAETGADIAVVGVWHEYPDKRIEDFSVELAGTGHSRRHHDVDDFRSTG